MGIVFPHWGFGKSKFKVFDDSFLRKEINDINSSYETPKRKLLWNDIKVERASSDIPIDSEEFDILLNKLNSVTQHTRKIFLEENTKKSYFTCLQLEKLLKSYPQGKCDFKTKILLY